MANCTKARWPHTLKRGRRTMRAPHDAGGRTMNTGRHGQVKPKNSAFNLQVACSKSAVAFRY